MIDNNAVFRRQPLNYHNTPFVMHYHRYGILHGVRPTPPQFAPLQTQPNMEDKVNTRREYFRANPDNIVYKNKYIGVKDSSTVTDLRKRQSVGKSSYYSSTNDFTTKNYNANDTRSALRTARSSGSVAPMKKNTKPV